MTPIILGAADVTNGTYETHGSHESDESHRSHAPSPAQTTAEENDQEAEEVLTEAAREEPLLTLEAAVARVPAELKKQMEELLRAEFREVWPR